MSQDISATPGQKAFPLIIRRKGQPIILEDIVQIVGFIHQGDFPDIAALRVGISRAKWDAMMKSTKPKYRRFQNMVDQAAALAQSVVTANLYEAAKVEPKIALEWLARTDPERWAPVKAREVKRNEQSEESDQAKEDPDVHKLIGASVRLFQAVAERTRTDGVLPTDGGAEPVHSKGTQEQAKSLPETD